MSYHEETRAYLDRLFAAVQDGRPLTHQPVFGLGPGELRPHQLPAAIRTFAQLRVLARLDGETLLDVGAAEGWLAHLAQDLLGFRTTVTDLSPGAVLRARQFFGQPGTAANAAALPFGDDAFDVVVCSEVLEHLEHPFACCSELARVAARHVLLTTECVYAEEGAREQALSERGDHPHEDLNHFVAEDLAAMLGGKVKTYAQMERLCFDVPQTPEEMCELLLSLTGELDFTAKRYGAMSIRHVKGGGMSAPRLSDEELAKRLVASALDVAKIDPDREPDPGFLSKLRCPACSERPPLEGRPDGLSCPSCGADYPHADGGVPDLAQVEPPPLAQLLQIVSDPERGQHLEALSELLAFDHTPSTRCEWTFGESCAPWTPENGLVFEDGELVSSGDDPILLGPRIELNQGSIGGIEIELASDRDGEAQLYWMTVSEPWFDESRSLRFRVRAGETAQVYSLMQQQGADRGDGPVVTRLRLDPLHGPGRVRLKRISVLTR